MTMLIAVQGHARFNVYNMRGGREDSIRWCINMGFTGEN